LDHESIEVCCQFGIGIGRDRLLFLALEVQVGRDRSGWTSDSKQLPVDRAARATGKTRTESILESAGRAAEDALLD
jgi:hypothetical protein